MASTLPLQNMSVAEKLQAMEMLWDDLCNRADAVTSPVWHANVLSERETSQARGEEQFEDWDAAKRNIKSKVS